MLARSLSLGIINIPRGEGRGSMEGMGDEREIPENAQLAPTVTDFKTPLSKEVRSTSRSINGRPSVGRAMPYDRSRITRITGETIVFEGSCLENR